MRCSCYGRYTYVVCVYFPLGYSLPVIFWVTLGALIGGAVVYPPTPAHLVWMNW
jgi:hypothetical protein